MSRTLEALALGALWILLGGWIGALVLFSVVVAPTAFQAFASPEAGRLVGPVLRAIHWYGAAAGVVLALLAGVLGRGRMAVILPLLLAAVSLASQLGVTPAIEAVRAAALGPDPDPAALQRFGRLHGLSMTLYAIVGIGTLCLAALHAWLEAARGRRSD